MKPTYRVYYRIYEWDAVRGRWKDTRMGAYVIITALGRKNAIRKAKERLDRIYPSGLYTYRITMTKKVR